MGQGAVCSTWSLHCLKQGWRKLNSKKKSEEFSIDPQNHFIHGALLLIAYM